MALAKKTTRRWLAWKRWFLPRADTTRAGI